MGQKLFKSFVCVACLSHDKSSVNKPVGGCVVLPESTSRGANGSRSLRLAVVTSPTLHSARGFVNEAKGASS